MTEDAKKHRDRVRDPSLHFRPECEGFRCGAHKSFDEGFDAGYAYRFEEYSKLDDINIRLNTKIAQLEKELKIAVEALEFYSVNGLAKVYHGMSVDERLVQEFYVSGGFARATLSKITGGEK